MSSKKLTALTAVLLSAGFDVETLLSAGGGTNPITDAIAGAKAEGVAEFLEDLGIKAHEDGPAAAVGAHTDQIEAKANKFEYRSALLTSGIVEALGVSKDDLDASGDAEAIKGVLEKAISAQTARQLASAGHEPLPVKNSEEASDINVMTLPEANKALASESDPVRYKKIYNRIVELEQNSSN